MKSLTICLFSESVTTSDGYRRGYVSFAHFLLYLGLGPRQNSRKCQTKIEEMSGIVSQRNIMKESRKFNVFCSVLCVGTLYLPI